MKCNDLINIIDFVHYTTQTNNEVHNSYMLFNWVVHNHYLVLLISIHYNINFLFYEHTSSVPLYMFVFGQNTY